MYPAKLTRIERIVRGKQTPLLIIDRGVIRQKFQELQREIGNARIYYALKTNPHWRIVELLERLGAAFEISSEQELNLLLQRGISHEKIIVSNPVKTESCVAAAYAAGIKLFAIDSFAEIEKISKLAPDSKVYVRLTVSNDGSQWPLAKKFGVETEAAVELLHEAQKRGLIPYGITFHVGSQCMQIESWVKAIEKSKQVWELALNRSIKLRMLNIGGGFPIKYIECIPSLSDIAKRIRETIDRLFPKDIEVLVEPGRVLVGEAGILVATVIGKAARNGEKWLYLDVGVFNGLMESVGGIKYPLIPLKDGKFEQWVLAGPSCDSFDVVQSSVLLPDLDIGDYVFILSAGAYTTAYASRFDGLNIPQMYFI